MQYPWRPHTCMSVWRFCSVLPLQVHIHKHTNSSVSSPSSKPVCISGNWRRGQGGAHGEGHQEKRSSHSLCLLSFPCFLEPSKESLSPTVQLQSSSVQLCHCVYVCIIYIYINIYLLVISFLWKPFWQGLKTEEQKLLIRGLKGSLWLL